METTRSKGWHTRCRAAPRAAGCLWTGALGLLLLAAPSCIPLVPEDRFLNIASDLVLDPTKTCDELKYDFGLPDVQTVEYPSELGLPYEETRVSTADGEQLRAWYLPHESPRGTVVISNGTVGTAACYLWIAKYLFAGGWSVTVYEYRGFGASTGTADVGALYLDASAAIDWAWQRTDRQPLILLGVSLGTIPVVAYAAEHPERVAAVVLDGAVSIRHELRRYWYLLGGRPDRYAEMLDPHFLLDEQARGLVQPTLAFTYGLDEWITPQLLPDLLGVAPGPVQLYHFPDLKHSRGPFMATDEYFAVLDDFLTQVAGL
jgi:fermentation-respiration switch protein FrsA (DUF1100 family)